MLPIALSWGPLVVRTFSLFLTLGLLAAAFVLWRKGREEHYPEDQLFDGFLLSLVTGFFFARVGFVVFHYQELGWNVWQWFDFVGTPGMSGIVGLIAAGVYLYRYASQKKWDQFEVMDFWVLAASLGLAIVSLGSFFDGSGYGYTTNLPWGVRFPGLFEQHHPVQLYYTLFYLALFWYLSWAEYRYRTFRWYRATKKAAQTGYLVCVFIIGVSLFSLIMSFLKPPLFELWEVNIDRLTALGWLVAGVLLLYSRSGRSLGFKKKKRRLFA